MSTLTDEYREAIVAVVLRELEDKRGRGVSERREAAATVSLEAENAYMRRMLDKYGLTDWKFSIEDLSFEYWDENDELQTHAPLGCCDFEAKTIRIDDTADMMDEFTQTVLHEIAHALVGRDGDHSLAWCDKAKELGCTSENLKPFYSKARRERSKKAA